MYHNVLYIAEKTLKDWLVAQLPSLTILSGFEIDGKVRTPCVVVTGATWEHWRPELHLGHVIANITVTCQTAFADSTPLVHSTLVSDVGSKIFEGDIVSLLTASQAQIYLQWYKVLGGSREVTEDLQIRKETFEVQFLFGWK